jgi:hypothetical protein
MVEEDDLPKAVLPPDFEDWDWHQLQEKCVQLGMSPVGNKAQFRKRLRAKLG